MLALAAKDRDTAKPAPRASPASRSVAVPELASAPAIAAPPGYFHDRLPVSGAGDPMERAADRTADALTAPSPAKAACPTCAGAGGQSCPTCGGKGGGAGGGAPLPGGLRSRFEGRLGADLGNVRLHTGPRASASALALNAGAYAVGRDIVLGRDAPAASTPGGERLLAHEVAHTLQPGGAIRRQEAAGGGPDPDIEAVRSLLRDGDEEGALAAIRRLSDAQGRRALADDNLRAEAVSTLDDEEMAEAMRLISGHLLMKLQWLKAEDTTIFEAMPLVERSPRHERSGAYADGKLRDWFVEICGDVEMLRLVGLLGGRLIEQLRWMAAEDSDWFPIYVLLEGGGASAEERREVLESAEMRNWFQDQFGDYHVGQAVRYLGGEGDLSLQMEWLQQEGSDVTPSNARKAPSIAPRDEALMGALDRASPLFRLFKESEDAREAWAKYLAVRASKPWGGIAYITGDATEEALAAKAEAAEQAFLVELKVMGYADVAAFKDEMRRFEAFFHGFALQTAFLMIRENRALAEKEGERMRGPAMDALYAELEPARALIRARRDFAEVEINIPAAGVTEEGEHAYALRDAVTQHERRVELMMAELVPRYPIMARKEEQEWAVEHAYERDALASHFQEFANETVKNADKVDERLRGDSSLVWKMSPALERAKVALGVAQDTAMAGIIQRKIAQVERDESFEKMVVAALAIGLGLLSFGAGTVAILAGAGAFALSVYQVAESWDEYSFKRAAYGSALDLADALSAEDPSIFWLILDIAGALLDLKGLTTSVRQIGKEATKAVVREAAEVLGESAKKLGTARTVEEAAEAALELEAKAAKFGPEVQAMVRKSAQRELAKRVAFAEAPALTGKLQEIVPALAKDDDALAGLLHMGQAAEAMATALKGSPELLQRLGRLSLQDPAVAIGAARLRQVVGDEAAVKMLRDALSRRDASFARRFLGAAGDGHLSEDALRAAAREGPAAAERELAKATGIAAPGTPEARAALESTAKLEGPPKNVLDLKNEWEAVQSSRAMPIEEGGYIAEVSLPNGHKWKQRKGGGWCRFSDPFCLTDVGLKALDEAPVDPFAQAVRRAEQQTAEVKKLLDDPKALEERFRKIIKDKLDPAKEFTPAEQDVLHDLLHQDNLRRQALGKAPGPEELDQVKPADIRSAFEEAPTKFDRRTGKALKQETPADIVRREAREAEEAALRALGDSNRPLLDKLHDALRQKTKDRILSRARKAGNGVEIDELLKAKPPSGSLDIDHIIPLDTIMEMPGFKKLGWWDQACISNAIDNLKAVDSSVNRSRQALSWTDQWAGRSLYTPEALKYAVEVETEARKAVAALIEQATKNPGSLTMP